MLEDLRSQIFGLSAEVLSNPERLFSAVLGFYEDTRIEGTNLDDDGDMLLFQWGSYDWGQGLQFELDLTRQAIPAGQEDSPIRQLRCTYRYDPTHFNDIVAGSQWCHSPSQLDEFRQFVLGSRALRRAVGRPQNSFELSLEDA